jgi:hypothetical protein
MTYRRQLVASLLPIAAIGYWAIGTLGSAEYMAGPVAVAEATTLDAAPRSRGPLRGARPAPKQPADSTSSTAGDTLLHQDHPRRPDGSRALPQAADPFALPDHEARVTTLRGARG